MKANFFIQTCIVVSLLFLSSCDYGYEYSYSVKNNTDTLVIVHYKYFSDDSSITIGKNETKLLFIDMHGGEGRWGSYYDSINREFSMFSVTKNGIGSKRDYLKDENWTFNSSADKVVQYTTIINNGEF